MIGHQPRAIRHRGQRPELFTGAGWRGMFDAKAKASEQPQLAPLLFNLVSADKAAGGHLALRAGRQRLNTPTTDRIGSASPFRRTQAVLCGYRSTSPEILLWVDGECWKITGSTHTLTKVIDTAALTAATVTLLGTEEMYGVPFGDKWIFCTDGSQKPFSWDGTTLGGVTELSNAPAFTVGPPAVYYAKLFFLKNDQRTITWSEENQENTGYEAGGFNNAWELTQVTNAAIACLASSNEGLYYGRASSIGVIRGAVTSTFQTDGVHESVSPDVGVGNTGYRNMRYFNGTLYWQTGTGEPWAYRPGMGRVQLALQLPRQFFGTTLDRNSLWGVGEEQLYVLFADGLQYDPVANEVYFTYIVTDAVTELRRGSLVVDANELRVLRWEIHPITDQFGRHELCELGTSTQIGEVIVDDGYIFLRRLHPALAASQTYYDEAFDGAGDPVVGTFIGPMEGWQPDIEWQFDQLDVVIAEQPTTILEIGYITSKTQQYSGVTELEFNSAIGANPNERRVPIGLNQQARWMRPVIKLTAGASGTLHRPELHSYQLRAYPIGRTVLSR
jgi:hypothetical protein